MNRTNLLALATVVWLLMLGSSAQAATPAEQLAGYSALAGKPAQPARGQQLFTVKHGKEWSCASCHTATPTVDGKHTSTGKVISPWHLRSTQPALPTLPKPKNGFAAIAMT